MGFIIYTLKLAVLTHVKRKLSTHRVILIQFLFLGSHNDGHCSYRNFLLPGSSTARISAKSFIYTEHRNLNCTVRNSHFNNEG